MNSFLKQKKTFVSLVLILNTIHLFINTGSENLNFNPIYGVVTLLLMSWLYFKNKGGENEKLLLGILSITFGFQVFDYLLNEFRVYDYLDLLIIKTNIPDLIIFFTLLTYLIFKAKSYQ